MQRLFELHLDARQEVPPQRTGKWLAHHHGASTEVHLPMTSHRIPQLIGSTRLKGSVCVCVLTSDLQVGVHLDPAPSRLPAQLALVGFLQQVDVLLAK